MNTKNYTQSLLDNPILDADSYKVSHWKFLQDNTQNIYSYIESRTGAKHDHIIFYGIQALIKKYLTTPITQFHIDQADWFLTNHGEPFNRVGWEYVLNQHNGFLPVIINTPDEGTRIPTSCPYLTIENTDKNPLAAWCGPYIETKLMRSWSTIAVATQSNSIRELILKYLEETGTPESIDYRMVDFGSRGVKSFEDSAILGAAHLTAFRSTDNLLGMAHVMTYYNEENVPGESISASEHSVTVARGPEGELQFYLDIVENFLGEGKMVSVVGDTYDLSKMLEMLGTIVKPHLLKKGGTWVVRPDSGIPLEQVMLTIKSLEKHFGCFVNEKGYKVLAPAVRIIQGDGITYNVISEILSTLKDNGYSADNITFGSGGFLLDSLSRDSEKTAMKASYVEVEGVGKEIAKNPATDRSKASKMGRVTTVLRNGKKICVKEHEILKTDKILLTPVFKNGKLLREITFTKIRENIKDII